MALIEIDGLPIQNGGSFHGYVSHNQMVYMGLSENRVNLPNEITI
jgi:hypothetical protein